MMRCLVELRSSSHSCSSLSLAVGHVLIDQQIIEGGLPSILFLRHPIGNIVHNNKNCDPMLGLIQISICDAIIDDDKDELRERKGKTKGYVSLYFHPVTANNNKSKVTRIF